MTPPDSNLSLPEVWRSLQRIEQSTAGLGSKLDMLRGDMDRRLDQIRADVISRREYEDNRMDVAGRIARVRADLEKLEDRMSDTRVTVWDLITRLSPVIATVIVLIATFQLRVG